VDQALRREVEGLLAQEDEPGSFMEEPAATIAAQSMVDTAPELDHSSLIIYTIIVSSILYFHRNTTGASLISSKY
jgi:hypothetical protein